jgi:hypothetical protein
LSVIPEYLLNTHDFDKRGWVPHHNEIAVDYGKLGKDNEEHRLYHKETSGRMDRMSYENQFRWRRNSAIMQVRKAYKEKAEG